MFFFTNCVLLFLGVRVEINESDKQGHLLRNHPTATEEEKLKVFTKNIVYREVLL